MIHNTDERIRILESEVEQLKHLARLKDEDIQSLRETNKALVDQTRSKWTVVQALSVLLMFFFALVFGYGLLEVKQAQDLVTEVKDALALVGDARCVTIATTGVVPQLASGYANLNNNQFERGASDADEGLHWANEWKAITKDSTLQKAIDDLRVGCLVLKARCVYLATDFESLFSTAEQLIEINSTAWEGYHFRGLCYAEHYKDVTRAIADYERSLGIRRKFNPDAFNLVELYFTDNQFEKAINHAEQYLVDFKNDAEAIAGGQFPSTLASLACMYRSIGRVFTRQPGASTELHTKLKQFRDSGVNLKAQFGPEALKEFIRGLCRCSKFTTLQREDRVDVAGALVEMVKTVDRNWGAPDDVQ